jgi:hypothetical protein
VARTVWLQAHLPVERGIGQRNAPRGGVTDVWRARVKFTIRFRGRVLKAELNDSLAAQDFASMLPLSVTLEDYAFSEKICDLPKRLMTRGSPEGFEPSPGDVAYYAPWGNLAIFYKGGEFSEGLVSLGHIISGVEYLAGADSIDVVMEA